MIMKPSPSLRHRIIKSSFVMTFFVCLLFSLGLFFALEVAEDSLFETHLESDINTFMDIYSVMPEIASLPRDNFTVYIARNNDRSHFPDYLKNLPEDEEGVELDGKSWTLKPEGVSKQALCLLLKKSMSIVSRTF